MDKISNVGLVSYQPNFMKKPDVKEIDDNISLKEGGMKKRTKFMLGATALALIVAGGLLCKNKNPKGILNTIKEETIGRTEDGKKCYKQLKELDAEIFDIEHGKKVLGINDSTVEPLLDKLIQKLGQSDRFAKKAYVIKPNEKSYAHLRNMHSDLHIGLLDSDGEMFAKAFFNDGKFVIAKKIDASKETTTTYFVWD